MVIKLRPLTEDEQERLEELSRARTAPNQQVERAKIILWVHAGKSRKAIAQTLGRSPGTVSRQGPRFNAHGLEALDDDPRPGRPLTYTEAERGQMIVTAKTHPQHLGQPYGHWSLDRLGAYINQEQGITISRAQLGRVLHEEGIRWYQEQTYFTERPDPQFAEKRGR